MSEPLSILVIVFSVIFGIIGALTAWYLWMDSRKMTDELMVFAKILLPFINKEYEGGSLTETNAETGERTTWKIRDVRIDLNTLDSPHLLIYVLPTEQHGERDAIHYRAIPMNTIVQAGAEIVGKSAHSTFRLTKPEH